MHFKFLQTILLVLGYVPLSRIRYSYMYAPLSSRWLPSYLWVLSWSRPSCSYFRRCPSCKTLTTESRKTIRSKTLIPPPQPSREIMLIFSFLLRVVCNQQKNEWWFSLEKTRTSHHRLCHPYGSSIFWCAPPINTRTIPRCALCLLTYTVYHPLGGRGFVCSGLGPCTLAGSKTKHT